MEVPVAAQRKAPGRVSKYSGTVDEAIEHYVLHGGSQADAASGRCDPGQLSRTIKALTPGFHSHCGSDGDDGDGQGSRFWAVWYGPQGEAPLARRR